jgi:hypothetical protein
MQRIGKHVPAATDTQAIIKVVRNGVLYSVCAEALQGRQLGQPGQFCKESEARIVQLEGSRRSDRT